MPPGEYFMMGDNRDNSTDSRVLGAVGYVPFENIIGSAQMIFFSIGGDTRHGRSGVGRGRCAGADCSRSCDERRRKSKAGRSAAARTTHPRARSRRCAARRRPEGTAP